MRDRFEGLPADARALLADPPDHPAVVQVGLAWRGLTGAHARVAQRLEVAVLTRDPLDWLPGRGWAWATAAGAGRGYRVALYATLAGLLDRGRSVLDGLASLAESAVAVGADHESRLASGEFARRAAEGRGPDLLSRPLFTPDLGAPVVTSVSPGWRPVGVQVLRDLVREAFGPPGRHAGDNPRATAALERALRHPGRAPTDLPHDLDARLAAAVEASTAGASDPAALREHAELVFDLAVHFVGEPDGFGTIVDVDRHVARWLDSVVRRLARAGLVDLAVEAGDVLGDLDPARAARHADEVVAVLVEAGRLEEAAGRVEVNLRDFPDDPVTRATAERVTALLAAHGR